MLQSTNTKLHWQQYLFLRLHLLHRHQHLLQLLPQMLSRQFLQLCRLQPFLPQLLLQQHNPLSRPLLLLVWLPSAQHSLSTLQQFTLHSQLFLHTAPAVASKLCGPRSPTCSHSLNTLSLPSCSLSLPPSSRPTLVLLLPISVIWLLPCTSVFVRLQPCLLPACTPTSGRHARLHSPRR